MKKEIPLRLNVDVKATHSDGDLRALARDNLDEAIRKSLEGAAAYAWDETSKSGLGKSEGTKATFIRKMVAEGLRNMTRRERDETETKLFQLLRDKRDEQKNS